MWNDFVKGLKIEFLEWRHGRNLLCKIRVFYAVSFFLYCEWLRRDLSSMSLRLYVFDVHYPSFFCLLNQRLISSKSIYRMRLSFWNRLWLAFIFVVSKWTLPCFGSPHNVWPISFNPALLDSKFWKKKTDMAL